MIPFRRYLGITTGLLGWAPETFWKSTPHEVFAAFEQRVAAYAPADADDRDTWKRL